MWASASMRPLLRDLELLIMIPAVPGCQVSTLIFCQRALHAELLLVCVLLIAYSFQNKYILNR